VNGFLPGVLGDAFGLLLAIVGFGAIIFIHELGHFLAARWAGIRVYAFAVGFGPAALAWRKGIGLRRGSTNPATLRALRERIGAEATDLQLVEDGWPEEIGKTEYRLNWLPFGGYVQMRGQDDVTPGGESVDARSSDSFSAKPVWKRMIVISAGVVMNVILAALLYIVVYMAGKPASPAIVGGVQAQSPAARAVAINAEEAGISEPGLRAGDRIVQVQGDRPREFADVWLAGALADPDEGLEVIVERDGATGPLRFVMTPERTPGAEFATVGLLPAVSTDLALPEPGDESGALNLAHLRAELGVPDGAVALRRLGGAEVEVLPDLDRAFAADAGRVEATLELEGGELARVMLRGEAELESEVIELGEGRLIEARHVAGFVAPMSVGLVDRAAAAGLRPGDVIARIGRVEWPGPAEGIRAIRAAAGDEIAIEVVREGDRVTLTAPVAADGTVGFFPAQSMDGGGLGVVVTRPLAAEFESGRMGREAALPPGTVIETVSGAAVGDYAELRAALAGLAPGEPATLGVRLPMGAASEAVVTLSAEEIERIGELGWRAPAFARALFAPAIVEIRADGPAEAVVMGVVDTHQIILRTYLTLVRLFEGTVEVEQLRGPVGIAHIGTQVAQRSFVELLFFFAVISANLAVLNFLPIPIADGGLMVFLIIEWITGKPVSPAVQNAAALVGLVLLGGVFLFVTFNDITRLL
jgi:regulator of sigma E protease